MANLSKSWNFGRLDGGNWKDWMIAIEGWKGGRTFAQDEQTAARFDKGSTVFVTNQSNSQDNQPPGEEIQRTILMEKWYHSFR